jgi:hypothetical protein
LDANAILYRDGSKRGANEFLLALFPTEEIRKLSGGVVNISVVATVATLSGCRSGAFSASEYAAKFDQLGCRRGSRGRAVTLEPAGTERLLFGFTG